MASLDACNCTQRVALDVSGANISTAAYSTISSALTADSNVVEIYNTTTKILKLALGAAGAEVDYITVPAAGNGRIGLLLNKGVRLSARAVDANATTGYLIINFYR